MNSLRELEREIKHRELLLALKKIENAVTPPTPEEDTATISIIAEELPDYKCKWCGRTIPGIAVCDCKQMLIDPIVQKISFHFGLPVKDIEKVLESKV